MLSSLYLLFNFRSSSASPPSSSPPSSSPPLSSPPSPTSSVEESFTVQFYNTDFKFDELIGQWGPALSPSGMFSLEEGRRKYFWTHFFQFRQLCMNPPTRQSSYLSQISQIIFVEIKLSCGEILGKFWKKFGKIWEILRKIGRFCHNLLAFMWREIEPKKYICGEKMTNMRCATRALHREYELVQKLVPASLGVTHGQKIE